jgi:hypothetical protein
VTGTVNVWLVKKENLKPRVLCLKLRKPVIVDSNFTIVNFLTFTLRLLFYVLFDLFKIIIFFILSGYRFHECCIHEIQEYCYDHILYGPRF